jgi:hypothetical protein
VCETDKRKTHHLVSLEFRTCNLESDNNFEIRALDKYIPKVNQVAATYSNEIRHGQAMFLVVKRTFCLSEMNPRA